VKDKSAETAEPASTPEEASDFLSKGALNLRTWTCTLFLSLCICWTESHVPQPGSSAGTFSFSYRIW